MAANRGVLAAVAAVAVMGYLAGPLFSSSGGKHVLDRFAGENDDAPEPEQHTAPPEPTFAPRQFQEPTVVFQYCSQ
jgi:hypothetical protein